MILESFQSTSAKKTCDCQKLLLLIKKVQIEGRSAKELICKHSRTPFSLGRFYSWQSGGGSSVEFLSRDVHLPTQNPPTVKRLLGDGNQ